MFVPKKFFQSTQNGTFAKKIKCGSLNQRLWFLLLEWIEIYNFLLFYLLFLFLQDRVKFISVSFYHISGAKKL